MDITSLRRVVPARLMVAVALAAALATTGAATGSSNRHATTGAAGPHGRALADALAREPVPALADGQTYRTTVALSVIEGSTTSEHTATRVCTATGCSATTDTGEPLAAAVMAPGAAARVAGGATAPTFLDANGHGPARWNPCSPIYWRLRPTYAPGGAQESVRQALRRLDAASGLHFSYSGATSYLPYSGRTPADRANLYVAFARRTELPKVYGGQLPAGVGSVSTMTHWNGVMQVVKGYAVLNADIAGRYIPVSKLLLHELGHAVNLGHVNNPSQVMNPTQSNTSPSDYGAVDRAGLARVGRNAGCLTVPAKPDLTYVTPAWRSDRRSINVRWSMRNHRPGLVSLLYVDGARRARSTVALSVAIPNVTPDRAHTVKVVLYYGATAVDSMSATLPRLPAR